MQSERMAGFVSSLWQSSVKFDDTKTLLDIFISGDDATSFEALTLIQQSADVITDKMRMICLNVLKSELHSISDFKKNLSVDLLEIFE